MADRGFRVETLALLVSIVTILGSGLVYQVSTNAKQAEKLDVIAAQLSEIKEDIRGLHVADVKIADHETRITSIERDLYPNRR